MDIGIGHDCPSGRAPAHLLQSQWQGLSLSPHLLEHRIMLKCYQRL